MTAVLGAWKTVAVPGAGAIGPRRCLTSVNMATQVNQSPLRPVIVVPYTRQWDSAADLTGILPPRGVFRRAGARAATSAPAAGARGPAGGAGETRRRGRRPGRSPGIRRRAFSTRPEARRTSSGSLPASRRPRRASGRGCGSRSGRGRSRPPTRGARPVAPAAPRRGPSARRVRARSRRPGSGRPGSGSGSGSCWRLAARIGSSRRRHSSRALETFRRLGEARPKRASVSRSKAWNASIASSQVVDEGLVERPGGLRDLVVERLAGDPALGQQRLGLLGVLLDQVVRLARLCSRRRVRLLAQAPGQRDRADQEGEDPRVVEEDERAVPGFEVAVVDLRVIRVPEPRLDAVHERQAVAEAGEAVELGQGLGDPGGDLEVLGLVAEAGRRRSRRPRPSRPTLTSRFHSPWLVASSARRASRIASYSGS